MGRLKIRTAQRGIGKGLFATTTFSRGDFIIEYTGKKILTTVADTMKTRYLFELDETWTIDGETHTNLALWINHSCEPNAEAETHDGHILISATRSIVAGEEVTIDYDQEYYDEYIKPVGCKCAAKTHRG